MEILEGKIYRKDVKLYPHLKAMYTDIFGKFADKEAFYYRTSPRDDKPLMKTYGELERDVEALSVALYDEALYGKRKIAVIGANSYMWCVTYIAAVCNLGVIVPLDPLLPANEILQLLQRSEVDTLICDASYIEKLDESVKEAPFLRYKFYMNLAKESDKQQEKLLAAAEKFAYVDVDTLLVRGTSLQAQGGVYKPLDLQASTLAALLFTSGTTSGSKAVMLSHYNITSDVAALLRVMNLPADVCHLMVLPLHHCFENTCGLHAVTALGGKLAVCDGLRYINRNLEEYHPQLLIGVPAIYDAFYKKILTAIRKRKMTKLFNFLRKLSGFLRKSGIDVRRKLFKSVLAALGGEVRVCITGAAPIRKELVDFFAELGIDVLQGYGMTECAPVIAGCNSYYNVPGTCGQPLGGITLAIDNNKAGEDGEILVKINPYPQLSSDDELPTDTPLNLPMLSYFQDRDASVALIKDKIWFKTQDVGHIEPETGTLVLTGRVKSMIVLRNGKKVFPEEIEEKLENHELIKRALVFGQELEHGEVVLLARLQLDADYAKEEALTANEIAGTLTQFIENLGTSLPSFKKLKAVYYGFNDMVMTTTLKIRREAEVNALLERLETLGCNYRKQTGLFNLDVTV